MPGPDMENREMNVDLKLPGYEESNPEVPLPHYTCNVYLRGNLLLKQELDSPSQTTQHRRWLRVVGEVRGTVLIITAIDKSGAFPASRTYTLQGSDVGIAADYPRRPNVLRVRAEGEQFLLATSSLPQMLVWNDTLHAAIDVSLDLDERKLPNHRTCPRAEIISREAYAALELRAREPWWKSKRERCWLAQPQQSQGRQLSFVFPPTFTSSNDAGALRQGDSDERSQNASLQEITRGSSSTTCWSRSPSLFSEVAPFSSYLEVKELAGDVRDVNVQADGEEKWRPDAIDAAFSTNMDYARRCARALKYCHAWKHDHYVKDGKLIEIHVSTTVAYRLARYTSAMSEYLAASRNPRDDARHGDGE